MKKIVFNTEKFETFLDERVKGCSYNGMFRPYHAINFDLETGGFWEVYEASNNQIFPNANPYIKVFDNGDEGAFDINYYCESWVAENEEQLKKDYIVPQDWDDMTLEEQAKWFIENHPDEANGLYEAMWENDKSCMLDIAVNTIECQVQDYDVIID